MQTLLHKLSHLLGCAGVSPHENHRSRMTAVIFEVPMLMAAVWILINWWSTAHGGQQQSSGDMYDLLLWGLFFSETVLLSALVNHRTYYLRSNWLNLVIIVLGFPMLLGLESHFGMLRLLRVVVLFSLLIHVGGRLRNLLSRNELGTTLLASVIVIIMAGIMMAAIDPAIESPVDGVWWAWVTVTTVGYGDLVPNSALGKVFASLVILLGLALFSMLTGTFAALFIEKKEEEMLDAEQEQILERLDDVIQRLEQLEERLPPPPGIEATEVKTNSED